MKEITSGITALLGLTIVPIAVQAADKLPEQIFRANCASCHGQLGEGGFSWIDPSQRAFDIAGRSTSSITKFVRTGRIPAMPAFSNNEINDTELGALADYVNGLPGSYVPPPVPKPGKTLHTVTVTDQDPWYSPMQLQAEVGDVVKYVNQGSTYHPVTQIDFVASGGAAGSDSGMLGPGGTYYRVIEAADDIDNGSSKGKNKGQLKPDLTFLCKIHPYMRGQVWLGQQAVAPQHQPSTPLSLPPIPGVGEVWVLAQFQDQENGNKDGVVQIIDAASWTVTAQLDAGNNPHNLWFSPNKDSAYLTNWFDNKLTHIAVDSDDHKTVGADYVIGTAPAHLISHADETELYVTMEGTNYVQQWDSLRNRPRAEANISGAGPHGIWLGGNTLMTSNSIDSTVSFIDRSTMQEVANLPAGLYPLGAGLNSTGTKGYAGNCLSSDVSIYHQNNHGVWRRVKDLYIGGCPVQAPVSPDDRYVVVPNSPYTTVIDTETNEIAAQFPTGKGAHGAAFGPKQGGGWYAYVSHKNEDYVSVIDMESLSHVGDVPLQTNGEAGNQSIFGYTNTGGNGITTRYTLP